MWNVFHRKTNIGIRKDGGILTGLIVYGGDVRGDGLPDVDALFGGVDGNWKLKVPKFWPWVIAEGDDDVVGRDEKLANFMAAMHKIQYKS